MAIKKHYNTYTKVNHSAGFKKVLQNMAAAERRNTANMIYVMIADYCQRHGKKVPLTPPLFEVQRQMSIGLHQSIKRRLVNAANDRGETPSFVIEELIKKYGHLDAFRLKSSPKIRGKKTKKIHLQFAARTVKKLRNLVRQHNRSMANMIEILILIDVEKGGKTTRIFEDSM